MLIFLLFFIACNIAIAATYRVNSNGNIRDPNGQSVNTSSQINRYKLNSDGSIQDNNGKSMNTNKTVKYIDIVLDYSGSMRRPIGSLKKSVNSIVSSLPDDTNIGLRKVGGDFTCKATSQLAPLGVKNGSTIAAAMESYVYGNEPVVLGLSKAISDDFAGLDMTTPKKIILITDGYYTCKENPCEFIENIMKQRNDISIDVIYTTLRHKEDLSCLAQKTGGNMYSMKSSTMITSAFEKSLYSIKDDSYPPPSSADKSNGMKVNSQNKENESQEQQYQYVPF